MIIPTPAEFSFAINLEFLKRSPKELLHSVSESSVTKLLFINNQHALFNIKDNDGSLLINFLNAELSEDIKLAVKRYVTEWFDLETDLKPFYRLARKDELLKDLVKKFYGYRIIGQPDLFESLVWAVLGQQINLGFAYSLKQRFVEKFGDRYNCEGNTFHAFPSPEVVSKLTHDDLLPLQFSRQKSLYVVEIAKAFHSGAVSKEKLVNLSLTEAKDELMKIKGIGNWTANYALMKTFRHPNAFPLEDAGLHNAIKNLMNLKSKPSLDRVKRIFKKYKGWEAYATLYLWKSL